MKKSISLAFLLVATLLWLSLPSVSATDISITPIGKTILVAPNETFVLAYKMVFNEAASGYFSATVYWICNDTTPEWNFTYVGFVCKFTDGTSVPGVRLFGFTKSGDPPIYVLSHICDPDGGVTKDGNFWFNVTMKAAGLVGGSYTPHAVGDQNITIFMVRCYEDSQITRGPGNCTIHVGPKIISCDSAGDPKEVFDLDLDEAVYVKGYGFNSSATIRLYVVPNATWTNYGQSIGSDIRGSYNTTITDSNGNLTVTRLGILPIGAYDIIADANVNGKYEEVDAVDDFFSPPGITVIPEFSHGIAMVMMATATSILFVTYTKKRRPSLFRAAKLK